MESRKFTNLFVFFSPQESSEIAIFLNPLDNGTIPVSSLDTYNGQVSSDALVIPPS
jgi:hypothetical protein